MVGPLHLFDLATKQAEWLSVRQKAVASNVANANTPNYQARDVVPFSAVLENRTMAMAITNKAHMDVLEGGMETVAMHPKDTIETTHSGNDVNMEDEMRKGGEIGREMQLNTAIIKAFHRMMMATVKGG